jgi:hypothetical protein
VFVGRLCRFPGRNYVENCGFRFRVATVISYGQKIVAICRDVPGKSRKLHCAISGIFRHENPGFSVCFSPLRTAARILLRQQFLRQQNLLTSAAIRRIVAMPRFCAFAAVCDTATRPKKGFIRK